MEKSEWSSRSHIPESSLPGVKNFSHIAGISLPLWISLNLMTNPNPLPSTPSLQIALTSGAEIHATGVMLYPANELAKAAEITANAHEELKGVNLGIGFIGSPEWAIGGGMAVGLLSGLIANSKAKKGIALLKEAADLQDRILDMGVMFMPEAIKNIERPFPSGWSGEHFDGEPKTVYGRVPTASSNRGAQYIALTNDLAIFEVSGKALWIRMSTISSYSVVGINVRPARRARHDPPGEDGKSGLSGIGPRVLK